MRALLCFALLVPTALAGAHNSVNTWAGTLQYDEDWGYAPIRQGANSFWWLYAVKPANNRPLFLWLQGGPGSSSSGFGNFEETGPKLMNGSDNPATWLQVADMVYVDNPVGAGFSYADTDADLTTNVTQIGQDLLAWFQRFLVIHSEYRTRPFYIFCESYGGKMAAEFARVITTEKAAGRLSVNFRGVGLGDSWISAMDYVNTWGEYLYASGYMNDHQLTKTNNQAAACQKLVDANKWDQATNCWGNMENLIEAETQGVSWYNILKKGGSDDWSKKRRKRDVSYKSNLLRMFNRHVRPTQLDALSDYMDGPVRQKLGIIPPNVKFGAQSGAVFNAQSGDFMRPNYDTVDALLKSGANVIVYNGNEDLICDTIGTMKWVSRLTWTGLPNFQSARRIAFGTQSFPLAGYHQTYQNFQFWWILRAGHMVAWDTPESAIYMLKNIVQKTAN